MKIVIDFRKYDGVIGGVEQGVVQITNYITKNSHQVVMLCKERNLQQVQQVFKNTQNFKLISLDVDTHVMSRKNAYLDSVVIQDIAEKEKADVIHFPYNWSFPGKKKRPSILTIHDVIPFTFREAQPLSINLFKYKPGIRKACKYNNMIATVSEFSKNDIVSKVGADKDKIRVIYNGLREVNPQDTTLENELIKKFGLENKFILNVGGIHERKNIPRLIEAFAGLVNQWGYAGKLLITGKASGAPYQDKMRRLCNNKIKENKLENRVVFTDFISESELDSLFRLADFLVYPSLYEGFGIPVLEGMKVGIPVITSNVSALPEIGKDAALYIDPLDVDDMVFAMSRLKNDKKLAETMKQKGPERAREFTWERTSQQYLDLYQEVCS